MTTWRVLPGLQWRQLGDEVVAMTGVRTHRLVGAGALVFLLLADGSSWDEVLATVADAEGRPAAEVADATVGVLRGLVDAGLAEAVP